MLLESRFLDQNGCPFNLLESAFVSVSLAAFDEHIDHGHTMSREVSIPEVFWVGSAEYFLPGLGSHLLSSVL